MTNADTTHANAPDAIPRPSDADASGGGDDAASAAKAGAKTGTARSGSSSSFSAEELASLDAVRDDAVRRYTRALAPKLGEKMYGHSEREAEREAAQQAKANDAKDDDVPSKPHDDDDASSPPGPPVSSDDPLVSRGKPRVTATAKVGVAALMAEVKTRAREYVARREAEFARAATAHAEAAEKKAREQRLKLLEEQKKQARGLGKVQFEHDAETDFVAEQKREAAARQAAERQHANELLEARLVAWPMSRVLAAVEEAFKTTLRERRRAAGLDQENELFSSAKSKSSPGDGDARNDEDAKRVSLREDSAEGTGGPDAEGKRGDAPRGGSANDPEWDPSERAERKPISTTSVSGASSRHVSSLGPSASRRLSAKTLSPEDAATLRAYDAACAFFGVTPNEKARDGLISASGVCDVSGACLGDDAACAVARGVARATKVAHLKMRACDIGPDGFRRIFGEGSSKDSEPPSLSSSNPKSALTSVDFSSNPRGLGTVGSRAFCRWLTNAVCPAGLSVVQLRGCDVRDADGAAVIAALADVPSLTEVTLAENKLGTKSATALAAFLETSPCLHVDVSANGFGVTDAVLIAAALGSRANKTRVEFLSLARNGLEDAGCVSIAESLARNNSIVALDLSRSRFGPAAATALANAFAKNTKVTSVCLDGNDIGADGCASLLRALDASVARRGGSGDEKLSANEISSSSSLRAVSLVDARTQDAAVAARALGERRFLAEGGGKKAKKGKKGTKGKKGAAKKGGKKGKGGDAVPLLQSELAKATVAAPGTFRAFETTRPEGRHVFDLADGAQRDIAAAMFAVDHGSTRSGGGQNIVNLTLDGDAVKEDPVAMTWPETLPTRGVLRFDFVALGVDDSAANVMDDDAFAVTLKEVGSRRLTPRERREALEQARRDRAFTCAQAAALLETFDVGESRVEAACMLLPRLARRISPSTEEAARDAFPSGDETEMDLALASDAQASFLAPLTAFEQTAVFARFGAGHARYLPFRRGAPSGRYELDMSLRCDRAVAASLAAEAAKDADFENFRSVAYSSDVSGENALSSKETTSASDDVMAWTRDRGEGRGPAPPPTSGVLSFEYVKKPVSFKDAAGAWTDGARRLRGVEAKAIAAKLKRRDAGPASRGYVAGSEADAIVEFRRAMCGGSGNNAGGGNSANQRTTTCAFAGAFVAAARDSETRVEVAVASRDFCVDVNENWLQVVESLRGDEQALACARCEAWPEANVAAGIAAFERSERKAERTARRREARLEREREAAEAKAAAEAEKAAEKAAREAAKAAEKAAREAARGGKKKKESVADAEADDAEADAGDGDAEARTEEDRGPDEEATEEEAAKEETNVDEADDEETRADAEDEAAADEATDADPSADPSADTSADASEESRTSSKTQKKASISSAADDEIDEEDGQPLQVGEPVMAPASMRYVLDCDDPTHAAVFKKLIAAAVSAPSKWRAIRNFRVGGAARDDLVENRDEHLETLFARAEAAAKEMRVVRDASAVDDVSLSARAARQRDSDIAFYERKRLEESKRRAESAKSHSRKNRGATRGEDGDGDKEEDDDFGFPRLDPPSRAHESYLSPSPFVVSMDFFGLDVFERLRAPFMEKQFYREAFLDMRAKSLEADRIRHAHGFHLREMAFEARDFELAEKARREKSAELEAQAQARAAEDAEEGADDEGTDAEGADEGADAAADATEDVSEDVPEDVAGEDAESTPAARSSTRPSEALPAEEEDSVPPEVAFATVQIAGPAFEPASSPWFSPLAPGAAENARRPREETSSDSFSTIGYRYAVDASLARASFADPSAVYRKTWERFGMKRVRMERDARYYAGEVAVSFLDENENSSSEEGGLRRTRRFHACPLREIWQTVRHETWRLNVADLESRLAKLDKVVALAAPAAKAARLAEEAVENANADPRLIEAREADPADQNLVKTLEAELAETLAPLNESLEKGRAKADAAAEAAATASREAAKLRDELLLLNTCGALGGDDATAPAKLANDVLKKLTGGVGFSDANVEKCCALTEACVESIRVYEAELKAFNENPPVVEPPKPGDDTPPPPPPQPPKRPVDVRCVTWRAFETMFMYTDFAESDASAANERDAKDSGAKSKPKGKASDKHEGAAAGRPREDAIAVAVRRERAEARAKAVARAEAAAARAKAAAEAEAAAREAAGEQPLDPLDAAADPRESATDPADSHHPLDASDEEEDDADGTSVKPSRPPLAVVGLPRITPAMLADFAASRAAAEKAALAAAAAAEAKAAKGAKGKKTPAKKSGKKDAPAEEPPAPPPPTARFAAGLFSGDDLLKSAAGVDPNPYVYVLPPEEEDAKK